MKAKNKKVPVNYVQPEVFDMIALHAFPLESKKDLRMKKEMVRQIIAGHASKSANS